MCRDREVCGDLLSVCYKLINIAERLTVALLLSEYENTLFERLHKSLFVTDTSQSQGKGETI